MGIDPKSGKKVSVKIGKFGPYVQIGDKDDEDKPTFVNLKKDQTVSGITFEEALALFELPKLPREIGFFEDKPMIVGIGKMGAYIKHDDKYANLTAADDAFTISEERAIELIKEKRISEANSELGQFEGKPINTGKGKFGPYVKHDGKFFSLQKGDNMATITAERAIEIIQNKRKAEANKFLKEFPENDTVKVLNGIYGPYIQVGKRNIKIPKGTEPESLTLEDCLKLANG